MFLFGSLRKMLEGQEAERERERDTKTQGNTKE